VVEGMGRLCGEDLSLKPRWSPIRELVTPADAFTQNTFCDRGVRTTAVIQQASYLIIIDKISTIETEHFPP